MRFFPDMGTIICASIIITGASLMIVAVIGIVGGLLLRMGI